jgi:hypothetical protein
MNNWIDYFNNPRSHLLKKTMYEVLIDRYGKNEQIIDRLGATLVTENDVKSFMVLISDIYEIAYLKAVQDHRSQLEKLGLSARIVPQEKTNY